MSSSSAATASRIRELLIESKKAKEDAFRLDELRRIFAKLIVDGELNLREGDSGVSKADDPSSSANGKWNSWLKGQHSKLVDQLCARVSSGKRNALRTFFGVMASSPHRLENDKGSMMNDALVIRFVDALCGRVEDSESLHLEEPMAKMVQSEFLDQYRDVQYFTLVAIKFLAYRETKAQQARSEESESNGYYADNLFKILTMLQIADNEKELSNGNYLIPPPASAIPLKSEATTQAEEEEHGYDSEEESDSESEADTPPPKKKKKKMDSSKIESRPKAKRQRKLMTLVPQRLNRHRKAFGEAWLAILSLPSLSPQSHRKALQLLPTHIIPKIHNPLRLSEYLIQSYKTGGVTSILSLDGLYLLMTQYGLEHADFFKSLYALIKPHVFYTKHRTVFLKLLSVCLNSNMLPAYLIAAFCKRLARSALQAPPSAALFVLSLISNLLRQHNECACLVHRTNQDCIEDLFDEKTDDPSKSRALESSLWEVLSLEKHYHPAVAALAKSCGKEPDNAMKYDLEPFLMHSYKSLVEVEGKRRLKGKVPLTFEEPKVLFNDGDVFDGILCV